MNMIKKNTASRLDKVRALLVVGEEDGGSEIVQTVIVLGFAVIYLFLQNFRATIIPWVWGLRCCCCRATSKPPSRKREPR